eukprot:755029-Hanusia_phi.AAC.8
MSIVRCPPVPPRPRPHAYAHSSLDSPCWIGHASLSDHRPMTSAAGCVQLSSVISLFLVGMFLLQRLTGMGVERFKDEDGFEAGSKSRPSVGYRSEFSLLVR